jgi:hypothetical protein
MSRPYRSHPASNGPIVTTSDKVLVSGVSGALAGASVELEVGSAAVGSKMAVTNRNL